jgi:hypothetical protein
MSQRDHGIDLRGAPGGEVTGKQGSNGHGADGHRKAERIVRFDAIKESGHQATGGQSHQEAYAHAG